MSDEKIMRAAIRLAAKGLGHTSPNPAVGAMIVSRGKVLARGFHRRAGLPHAEIEALNKTKRAKGATLYVTLEPCSTQGRTPPCVEAIIRAGITRVVIGAIDPNPAHAGRAVKVLCDAGIEATTGVLADECREINKAFNKWIVTGMPFVIAKAGMSLDGRMTRPPREGRWITSPASRTDSHKLRAQVDAILIGAGTLRADNPKLTVRGMPGAKQPWRVVVSRTGKNLPPGAHLFTDEFKDRTVVFKGKSLRAVLHELGKRGVTSVMIEGGPRLLADAFDRRLVDEVRFYLAPLLIGGGGAKSVRIKSPSYKQIGGDMRICGEVEYPG